jgi:hypothetical protein
MVDPIFRVIFFVFIQGRLPLREAIGTTVFVGGDVHQFEIEEEDGGNPAVDGSVGLDVGIAEHTFNVTCIHFNYEIVDANKVEVHHT